jgi:hypothetical protein
MISIKYIFFLKELFRKLQHPSLEDGVGSSDAQTPQHPTTRYIPARLFGSLPMDDSLVIEMIEPSRAHGTPSTQCTSDHTVDGGDEEIGDSTNCFPGSLCVTGKGTLIVTFLVYENISLIKIQKILGIY